MALTNDLCAGVIALADRPFSAPVERAAQRTLLNVLGTAIGASRYRAVEIVVAHAREHGGAGVAPVPGRRERLDAYHAALATGLAAHIDDFDDTHLATVIHPGAATMGAVLALGAGRAASGERALRAFALGCEAQLRVGMAISPSHYDAGWHITGTCGVVGAAVAAGVLLGFDAETLEHALGIAASETLGQREAFGSMTKAFHPGKAAANGVLAARLAQRGFTGARGVLEAPRGLLRVLADQVHPERVTDAMGERWELCENTFKPYPCGIVSHPAIDAALQLSAQIPGVERIARLVLRCNPLVVELMGRTEPADGLGARFSAAHAVSAALADGRAGIAQFEDARVVAPDVTRLRGVITFDADAAVRRDEATLEVELDDGSRLRAHVEHARGSLERPLTDDELAAKVRDLVEPVQPGATAGLLRAVERLASAPDLEELIDAVTPSTRVEGAVR